MQIKFKPHKREDIPYRVKWFNNFKANQHISDLPNQATTLKREIKWFNNYLKDKNKIFFTIYDGKFPIGCVGLSKIDTHNRNAEAFIIIGEDGYRGKGIGKLGMQFIINYGFNKLKLHKISLGVIEHNEAAIKCYKSIGFKVEGILKDSEYNNDKYSDLILMAVFNK